MKSCHLIVVNWSQGVLWQSANLWARTSYVTAINWPIYNCASSVTIAAEPLRKWQSIGKTYICCRRHGCGFLYQNFLRQVYRVPDKLPTNNRFHACAHTKSKVKTKTKHYWLKWVWTKKTRIWGENMVVLHRRTRGGTLGPACWGKGALAPLPTRIRVVWDPRAKAGNSL